jgi:tetratricopeptide (TPR) repeat protein
MNRMSGAAVAALLAAIGAPSAIAQQALKPAPGPVPQTAAVDYNEYYRFPLSVGVEYQNLTPVGGHELEFSAFDIAADLRYPVPGVPVLQPYLRGGMLQVDGVDPAAPDKWDHTQWYGALGLAYVNRFSRNFEIGGEVGIGASQSVFPNLVASGPVGGQSLVASAGARISLAPSYSVNVEIHPALRYLRSLSSLTEFDGFLFGLGFAINYRFGEDPDSPAALIRSLRFGDTRLPALFSAMQSYYAKNAIGRISMTNTERYGLTDLEVSFNQPGYMDSPTPSASRPSLAPGESWNPELLASFNQEVFKTEGTTPLTGEVIVRYKSRGRAVEQRQTVTYDLYDRTAITWDDDRKVGAFVTPADSALRNYASFARQTLKEETAAELNEPLQAAMQIYAALREIGLLYQVDPTSPFTQAQGNKLLVDSINLPRDTLKRTTGDCDDLTVLFSSLLETVGIETGFITLPGHIYAAFNTRVPSRDYRELHPDRSLTINVDGELWVPFEVTMIGTHGFLDAWRRGAELWRTYEQEAGKRVFVKTREAQALYRPVGLRESDLGLQYGSSERIVAGFRGELRKLGDLAAAEYAGAARASNDKRDYHALGMAYVRYGRYREAEQAFGRALQIDPGYVGAQVNLGNLAFLQKDYRRALTSYQGAVQALERQGKETSPTAQKVLVNLSQAYQAMENYGEAQASFARASKIDPERVREFAYLAQVGAAGARAAEQKSDVVFIAAAEE